MIGSGRGGPARESERGNDSTSRRERDRAAVTQRRGEGSLHTFFCLRGSRAERYRSGQTGQTVNLLAYAFGGSNPSLATMLRRIWETPELGGAAAHGRPLALAEIGRSMPCEAALPLNGGCMYGEAGLTDSVCFAELAKAKRSVLRSP